MDDDDRDDDADGELEITAKVLRKAIHIAYAKGRRHQRREFDELLARMTRLKALADHDPAQNGER